MKKLVSIILATVLLLTVAVAPVFAQDTAEEKEFLYKEKFIDDVGCFEHDPDSEEIWYPSFRNYDELYYHRDDNGAIDWALISADVYFINPWEVVKAMQIGNRVIKWWVLGAAVFPYGLAIYDVAADEFYCVSVTNPEVSKPRYYPGLAEAFDELCLGLELGDVDMDGMLSILDATEIQRYLAKIIEPDSVMLQCKDVLADVYDDGEMNILDATAIQRKLAKLDKDPNQKPAATPDQPDIRPNECFHPTEMGDSY